MKLSAMNRVLDVVVAIFFVGFLCACEADPEDQAGSPTLSASAKPAQTASSEPEIGRMDSIIKQHKQSMAEAEGREGILAEQRLYSVFDEELIIRDFFQDRREGFFLDVGCSEPVKGSNTYYLEKHLGWSGIGIDALVDYREAWLAKRKNSRFFAYLVTDRSGVQATFFKSPGLGISSTNQAWASGKAFGANLETEELQIESITLNDLLDRENVTKIDLLAMDIEGHEPQALAGFDIERFSPELVAVEKSVGPRKNNAVRRYFEAHGYRMIERYVPFDPVNRYFERRSGDSAGEFPIPLIGRI